MRIWKRNAVVAAVLVFVCAGIYLNWSYNQSAKVADLSDALDAEKVMGENLIIGDGDSGLVQTAGDELGSMASSFAEVRLSRQTARDSAVETLQEAMAFADADEDMSATSNELNSIVNTALAESQIESLIIAKGYEACVAYVQDDVIYVTVAAPAEGLTDLDVALISDVVTAQTDYSLTQIRVVEVK